ncbi:MAG: trypsin-like peptidase domain-containing protein [Rhodothermales bacterium]
MPRLLVFSLVLFVVFGCNRNAQSQWPAGQADEARSDTSVTRASESIAVGRMTAITRAVEKASPAVVSVNVTGVEQVRYRDPFANMFSDPWIEYFFGQQRRDRVIERQVQNLGSGFVISPDGYIVTNEHVARNATSITVAFPNGRTLEGRLVGSDAVSDLALIKVDPDAPLPFLEFGDGEGAIVGEWVIALGNPFGLFEAAQPSVTVGVVSAVGRNLEPTSDGRVYRDMIQTDAAINRGNSGGPLVNALGEVIGVNTAIYSQTGGSVGIGFAVPTDRALRIIGELREHGEVDRSFYSGLTVSEINRGVAEALGLEEVRGVLVRDVDPDSPAEEGGFQPYDVIVSIEGEPIQAHSDLVARLYDFRPGDDVRFGVIREGSERDITIRLGRP